MTLRNELQAASADLTNTRIELARVSALFEGAQKQLQANEAELLLLREIVGEKYRALVHTAARGNN